MIVRQSIPLSSLTTFKIGGAAAFVIDCESESDIREALSFAKEHSLPWYILGGGSNLLVPDEGYPGVIIRPLLTRLSFETVEDRVFVVAEAGVPWDAFVTEACARGLWGVENLAGIPGTVGAAPIQNIGAYGADVSEAIDWVEALDPEMMTVERIAKDACGFGYRDSRFKRSPGLIILRVAFTLSKHGSPRTTYADLARAAESGILLTTPTEIAMAVRAIRARKFPDLTLEGTAGSFFKNPHVPTEAFVALQTKYPELPGFPSGDVVKVPLAWILDRVLSLKGYRAGKVRLFEAQPLVIAADQGATAHEVTALAREVAARVKDATGITLEWEVRTLS